MKRAVAGRASFARTACRFAQVALLVIASSVSFAATVSDRPPVEDVLREGPTLGLDLEVREVDGLVAALDSLGDARARATGRLVARLVVRWEDVERTPGAYDWSGVDGAIRRLDDAGVVVALALDGERHPEYVPDGGWPTPFVEGSVDAYAAFASAAVAAFDGRVTVFEIGDRPFAGDLDAERYAFVLKRASLAIRAAARESGVLAFVAQGALESDRPELQGALWARDVAPYVDVLPVAGAPDLATLRNLQTGSLRFPPAPALWALGAEAAGAAAALDGAAVALLDGDTANARFVAVLQAELADGFSRAPLEAVRFVGKSAADPAGPRAVAQFFRDDTFESLVILDGGADVVPSGTHVVVPTAFANDVRILDPAVGEVRRAPSRPVEGEAFARAIVLPIELGATPVLLRYRAAPAVPEGLEVDEGTVEVARGRDLTAEEVIARYREVQQGQDDRLDRWMARARVDFHFRFSQGASTVDIGIESNYFWERGGELEWEQTDYYLNGNRLKWDDIPELPLIQPEKVITLPLDLTLDRTYAYRLAGRDRVGGRDAYVLAFRPGEDSGDGSLYQGRVWIDAETFVRLKVSVVQNGLEAPVLSNEERDLYRAVEGPDGREYRMLSEIDGQQVWSTAGRTFVVQRELEFLSFELNPTEERFREVRSRAYASNHQMLRDTEEGFRYLERAEDGSRRVKTTVDTSQLFALGGLFKDGSIDGVVPLAGVNYFNYDLGGVGLQANVFFAGALAFGTLTYPDLFDRKIDVTLDLGGTAILGEDKVFQSGDEIVAERFRTRRQRAALRVGFPVGQFVKLNAFGRVQDVRFWDSEDGRAARPAGLTTVLPEDHRQSSVGAQLEFNRKGYTIRGETQWFRRSSWRPWGLFETATGAPISFEYDPTHQNFTRFKGSISKEWYLSSFQKIRGEVDYLDGDDLDRFSRYEFSFFGDDRLNGFSGSGVRFDEGWIARTGYSFNVFEAVRFDAALESARVEDFRSGDGTRSFTGFGLSGNFIGPWKTVVNLNWGIALDSDVSGLSGDQEFLLVILKLF